MPDIFSLIQSAGPGQINDVFADIRALVNDDAKVTSAIAPHLATYNKTQFITARVESRDVILSSYNELSDSEFYDAATRQKFKFDHVTLKVSDVTSHHDDDDNEDDDSTGLVAQGDAIRKALDQYLAEHYPSISSACLVTPDAKNKALEVCIVGNKYNTSNFWTGRWRSHYTVPISGASGGSETSEVKGRIEVDVHYYEDGNVRLLTKKDITFSLPQPSSSTSSSSSSSSSPTSALSSSGGDAVVKGIERIERTYQDELNRAFGVLGSGSFKDLRRALPVTRAKMNWTSVAAMRIGQEVQGGRERK